MTPPRRRPKPRRGGRATPRRPADFWKAWPEPDVPASIVPPDDPAALLRSLGPPPLPGQASADQYLVAVAERASVLATALAAVADLLSVPDED